MTTSTPTNEGIAIAGVLLAQAKGDVQSARRILCDAHHWMCSVDPTFKPDDKDRRIAELEEELQAAAQAASDDAVATQLTEAQAKVSDLSGRLHAAKGELNDLRTQRSTLHRQLAAAKAEIAQMEARAAEHIRTERELRAELAQRDAVESADDVTASELAAPAQAELVAASAPTPKATMVVAPAEVPWSQVEAAAAADFVAITAPAKPSAAAKPAIDDAELEAKFAHLPPAMRRWAIDRAKAKG